MKLSLVFRRTEIESVSRAGLLLSSWMNGVRLFMDYHPIYSGTWNKLLEFWRKSKCNFLFTSNAYNIKLGALPKPLA